MHRWRRVRHGCSVSIHCDILRDDAGPLDQLTSDKFYFGTKCHVEHDIKDHIDKLQLMDNI